MTFKPVDTGDTWQSQLSARVVSGGRDGGRKVMNLGLREESADPVDSGTGGTPVDAVLETQIQAIRVQGIELEDFSVSILAESRLLRVSDHTEFNHRTHQYHGPSVAFDPMGIKINNDRLIEQAILAGLDALAVEIVAAQLGFDANPEKARR